MVRVGVRNAVQHEAGVLRQRQCRRLRDDARPRRWAEGGLLLLSCAAIGESRFRQEERQL